MSPHEVVQFWLPGETDEARLERSASWFRSTAELDAEIEAKFGDAVAALREGGLRDWRESPEGCLGYIILADQFTRNIYRGSGLSFASDALAREACLHALEQQHDRALSPIQRMFIYMPLMHSERRSHQACALGLFEQLSKESDLKFCQSAYDSALWHAEEIARFGRFPGRNKALGRQSTPGEIAHREQR